jgi:predicted Zn-ribbon and HTH transcriptional regulator
VMSWTSDLEERKSRRPRQKIDHEERRKGGSLVISPAWIYACTECGNENRLATEEDKTMQRCGECGEVTWWEPLGELVYPGEESDA